ncbi:hypothetical protein [Neoroseomonas rubea]|uniref:hypothetical protein n=1 Tax=Neoroseomonas rubea TaxID=2748666 RepID=UPI0018DF4C18|nr:hypothetical protein [Roseomonas rubea]
MIHRCPGWDVASGQFVTAQMAGARLESLALRGVEAAGFADAPEGMWRLDPWTRRATTARLRRAW